MSKKSDEATMDAFNYNKHKPFIGEDTAQTTAKKAGIELSPVRERDPKGLKRNPLNTFEGPNQADRDRLKDDIQTRGILVPLIAKQDGTLLAGHTRLSIALEIGLEIIPVQFVESELNEKAETEFILKDNVLRRQLSEEQKILILAKLYPDYFEAENLRGGNQKSDEISKAHGEPLIKKLSKDIGESPASIKRAKQVYQAAKKKSATGIPTQADIKTAREEKNRDRQAKSKAITPFQNSPKNTQEAPESTTNSKSGDNLPPLEKALDNLTFVFNDWIKQGNAKKKDKERYIIESRLLRLVIAEIENQRKIFNGKK